MNIEMFFICLHETDCLCLDFLSIFDALTIFVNILFLRHFEIVVFSIVSGFCSALLAFIPT